MKKRWSPYLSKELSRIPDISQRRKRNAGQEPERNGGVLSERSAEEVGMNLAQMGVVGARFDGGNQRAFLNLFGGWNRNSLMGF